MRLATSEKEKEIQQIQNFLRQYNVVGAAGLQKVRAAQLQELRRKLEDSAYLRVTKNTLMKKAIADLENKPNIKDFEKHLIGSNIFLFTNLNPFKLALILKKSRVLTKAKAGDTAAKDVVVPAGNTGLPPGPIISQLGAVGLPTRIESGSVWINRDTVVAKKGDVISERLASALSKLGIKCVEVGLAIKVAYDDGAIITEDEMNIDLDKTREELSQAHSEAFNLSIGVAYPLPENIAILLQMSHQEARNLALNSGIFNSETISDFIRRAHAEMSSLIAKVKQFEQ